MTNDHPQILAYPKKMAILKNVQTQGAEYIFGHIVG